MIIGGGLALSVGCSTLAKRNDSGVVVATRVPIRSSTAVVAADILFVSRGDQVDVLESVDVRILLITLKKSAGFRVSHDEESTEGWIESRNVMPEEVLEASRKIAEEDKLPAQATGQLRSSSNFRLTPDRSQNENIMMRLDSGSSFEIVGWKRVPKSTTSESIESDVAPKAGSAQQGAQSRGPDGQTSPKKTTNSGTRCACQLQSHQRPAVGFTGSKFN